MQQPIKMKEGTVLEKFREAASNLREDVEQLGKITRDAASESVDQVHKNISELYEKGQEKVVEAEQQFEGYVQKHPLRVLFLALGAGFFVGWLRKRNTH